jgi:3-isopropylmalate dehydrogenase
MSPRIVVLAGDGIGPEVMAEALRALTTLLPAAELDERLIGRRALDELRSALPDETLHACRSADAVLMGAVGASDYAWDGDSPEDGMFRLRRELDVYANLRPFHVEGVDVLIVRELVGGLYFGARGTRPDGTVFDTCEYHPRQVERVLRRALEQARERRGRVTSVDKANVLATSRMWRGVAERVALDYADVELEHLLVDTAAMHLIAEPERFDVIVTENTFGDILSDVAAAVTGGLGVAASASLGDGAPGLFEPVHGTAPDLAGRGVANPSAMLRSVALMLRYGLGRPAEADVLERAVAAALREAPTVDFDGTASTRDFGDHVVASLRRTVTQEI